MSADSVGRYSTEISAECRSRCRPIVSVECRSSVGRVSADISTDILHRHTRLTYSTDIVDRHLGRDLGERSTDIWSSIGRHALQVGRPSVATIGPYLVGMSVYTRPTRRPLCYDELSAAYRSTVGGILCIVKSLFC